MSALAGSFLLTVSVRPKSRFSKTHNYDYSIVCHWLPLHSVAITQSHYFDLTSVKTRSKKDKQDFSHKAEVSNSSKLGPAYGGLGGHQHYLLAAV
jgi:hypothetical protein